MESREEQAAALFKDGYNCAQAVFAAYADIYGLDKETALRLSSSFGGGMGGMREVCGSVSAMIMLAGLAKGSSKTGEKRSSYEMVQQMTDTFKNQHGAIICRQLLGLEEGSVPGIRKKPCVEYVRSCASIVADLID